SANSHHQNSTSSSSIEPTQSRWTTERRPRLGCWTMLATVISRRLMPRPTTVPMTMRIWGKSSAGLDASMAILGASIADASARNGASGGLGRGGGGEAGGERGRVLLLHQVAQRGLVALGPPFEGAG